MDKVKKHLYSWEKTHVDEYETGTAGIYNKTFDKWLKILESKNVEKKCVAIINNILDDFSIDDYVLIEDLFEAINREA